MEVLEGSVYVLFILIPNTSDYTNLVNQYPDSVLHKNWMKMQGIFKQ
jgi:hypothetical protein